MQGVRRYPIHAFDCGRSTRSKERCTIRLSEPLERTWLRVRSKPWRRRAIYKDAVLRVPLAGDSSGQFRTKHFDGPRFGQSRSVAVEEYWSTKSFGRFLRPIQGGNL